MRLRLKRFYRIIFWSKKKRLAVTMAALDAAMKEHFAPLMHDELFVRNPIMERIERGSRLVD